MPKTIPAPAAHAVAARILLIRDQKVLLDHHLAELYDVETRTLNQAVKRNLDRFPSDFMFQLTDQEVAGLRSQIVISNARGGRRYNPHAFTEHGAVMLASVLNSPRAVEMSIVVVRAFVQLREMLSAHKELAAKLDALERKVGAHDRAIADIIGAIRQLTAPPAEQKRPIGFTADIKTKRRQP